MQMLDKLYYLRQLNACSGCFIRFFSSLGTLDVGAL